VQRLEGRVLSTKTSSSWNHGDEGTFDAFLDASEIIFGCLTITFAPALLWIALLRFFAKPVIIAIEGFKVTIAFTIW